MRGSTLIALVLAATVTVTGCGVIGGGAGGDTPTPTAAPTVKQTGYAIPKGGVFAKAKPLASLSYTSSNGDQARLDVLAVQRLSSEVVVARFRLVGDEAEVFALGDQDHLIYQSWDQSFNAVRLVDLTGRQLYVPMAQAGEGHCACSEMGNTEVLAAPGGTFWAAYPVPKHTLAVAFMVRQPNLGVTGQVPVAGADAPLPKVPGEPAAGELADATGKPYPLSAASFGKSRRVTSTGRTVNVGLPADVLFEFGKSTLTGKARGTLRRAANRLKADATGTVTIVGHTDAIGSEQDNLKLSQERARAVAEALRPMLQGSGLTLDTAGKGEADPVAPNRKNGEDNPEGRQRNRRVEISYQRRVQPPATSATPKPAPASTGTVGTVSGTEEYTAGITIRLHGVRRLAGGTALVRFTATNTAAETIDIDQWTDVTGDVGWLGTWLNHYQGGDAFWVRLRGQGESTYFPLADSVSQCVCAYVGTLEPGERTTLWAVTTAPPKGVRTIGVIFDGYGTIKNVPLQR